MQKDYEKIFDLFFREAELGNWRELSLVDISKKLKMTKKALNEIIPNKNRFLEFYNNKIDQEIVESISEEELKISSKDEIIQEFFMSKLEIMEKYKFALINILNCSIKDPAFLLINLKSNKSSMEKFINKVSKKKSLNKIILSKLLLVIWLFAFNKWLYEENDEDSGLAAINKGFNRIKKNTDLFSKI